MPIATPIPTKSLDAIGGLVFVNCRTGECTTDQGKALEWVLNSCGVKVNGYFTYEWDGDVLKEVYH